MPVRLAGIKVGQAWLVGASLGRVSPGVVCYGEARLGSEQSLPFFVQICYLQDSTPVSIDRVILGSIIWPLYSESVDPDPLGFTLTVNV